MGKIFQVSLAELITLERRPVEIISNNQYAEIGIYCFGRGIFHKMPRSGLEVGNKKLFLVKEGDFILQITFAWEGAVGLASSDEDGMYCSTRFPTFRVDENRCFPLYLLNYFRTPLGVEQLDRISSGSAGRNRVLSLKRIKEIVVPLPPLEEQRRIVEKIEDLAGKIDEARSLREQTVKLTKAFFTSASTKILGNNSTNSCLSDILLEKPKNGWSPRRDNLPTGIPVLSLGAVTGFNYNGTEFKRTSESTDENAHYWLRKGDLLITRSNSPELVGHAAIYDGNPSPCIYPDLMMRLQIDESKADKRFVHFWLTCTPVRDYIKRNAKGTSPSMKKISQGVVMKIPFPADISLPEQQRIVVYLDRLQSKVDKMKRLREQSLQELDALLPSILDKAFKSEL